MGLRTHFGRLDIALAALLVSFFTLGEVGAHAQEPAPPPPAAAPPAPPAPAPGPAPVVSPEPLAPVAPVDAAAAEAPLAGFHNGTFYLRSKDDDFRIYVQGRVHVDSLNYFGPGVSSLAPGDALKSTLTLRRVRLEVGGEFYKYWQWQLGAEFGQTSIDNAGANTASGANTVDPATSIQTFGNKQNAVEAPSVKPIPTDAFINFGPTSYTNVQVGQFYVPFSFENRLSDNFTPFLEKAIVTRGLATPNSRDIGAMFWGESPDKLLYYAIGLFNGDGQNRLNADSRYDVDGRVVVKPFAPSKGSLLQELGIGVSGRYGSRDKTQVGYDVSALSTQGGFAFWRPTYKDSLNRTLHVLPSGDQTAFGVDINAPISIFDLTGEVVYTKTNTREAVDGYQLSPFTERFGDLKGYGYYLQAGVWVLGSRDVIGYPGYGKPTHLDLTKPQRPSQQALQVLAKLEQVHLSYDGASRGGTADSKTPNGDIDATNVTLGVNYYATRHLRVSLNYGINSFPSSTPVSPTVANGPAQSSNQRAIAPAQLVAKGVDDDARSSGHVLHEVQARVGVQF